MTDGEADASLPCPWDAADHKATAAVTLWIPSSLFSCFNEALGDVRERRKLRFATENDGAYGLYGNVYRSAAIKQLQ